MSSQYFRFVARDIAHVRAPLLEQLIARADAWAPVADWRADAFRAIAPQAGGMPAVAADGAVRRPRRCGRGLGLCRDTGSL